MEQTQYSPEWAEIGQSVINEFADEKFKNIAELSISIGYVLSKESPDRNGKAKLAECIAVKKDHQAQFIPHDYIIKIYEPNVAYMNDMQKRILMEHELMHIRATEDSSGDLKIQTAPHEIEDFKDIIEKYGIDWAQDLHQQMTWDEYETDEDEEETDQVEGERLQLPEEETA